MSEDRWDSMRKQAALHLAVHGKASRWDGYTTWWLDLLAERDRYRKALEEIANLDRFTHTHAVNVVEVARAALEGPKP